MPIISAYIVPHPPLIIPEIGKGEQLKIQKTIDSYEYIAQQIADKSPDTIIFITPHSVSYSDYIHISPGLSAEGNFGSFGAKDVSFGVMYEKRLVKDITSICEERSIMAGNSGGERSDLMTLDHGMMVPLYFIHKYFMDFRCVRVSISGLPFSEHYKVGQVIKEVCEDFNRNTVIIASGDLSHKLKNDGPYGFSTSGPLFDKKICEIIERASFADFMGFSENECASAAECGLRTFIVMSGILDRLDVESKLLSYEGPFGVGYAAGEFIVTGENKERDFSDNSASKAESPHVILARQALESYVKKNEVITPPGDLDKELLENKAGVFVSLKSNGQLRGCIGTISSTRESIAKEIIANAISAGVHDPRFKRVSEKELPELEYSVDVLGIAEPISDKSELDVLEYGVIVNSGAKRGLLLPNLEGIDTVDEQIEVALQKAGISPSESYEMERFKVVRYK